MDANNQNNLNQVAVRQIQVRLSPHLDYYVPSPQLRLLIEYISELYAAFSCLRQRILSHLASRMSDRPGSSPRGGEDGRE